MRRRWAVLLVVVAGGLAAGSATLGNGSIQHPEATADGTTLARADLADVPAPAAASRARDGIAREHEVRRDVAAGLGLGLALTLAGGWWIARDRAARVRHRRPVTALRTRAPPRLPAIVHC
jgi:hypothetical protein